MEYGYVDRLQSEFSGDLNYLNRLNAILYACEEAAITLDCYTWFHSLMALYRELSTEFKKNGDEMEVGEGFIDTIDPMIAKYVGNINNGSVKVNIELRKELHKFELFLRGILKSSGLQNKMKEDAGAALK